MNHAAGGALVELCPSMRNPSGGAPGVDFLRARLGDVSIDEKPVRRCATTAPDVDFTNPRVSIDEKPVRRCAEPKPEPGDPVMPCPSMRNPSGGAPHPGRLRRSRSDVSIDEKPVRRCAWTATVRYA